jgi:glyceraldehyde-3-phosphate dehydrogenase (NADP+)
LALITRADDDADTVVLHLGDAHAAHFSATTSPQSGGGDHAALADERQEQMAQIISQENGKSILEARSEAARSGEIMRLSAFEGSQLYGVGLPLDANKGTGQEKLGFTLPQPVGVVVAVTPFNYPALLVMHKIGPALAVGNAVILKPARTTPLTAIALAQCFIDAGLPEGVLSVITGPGAELGEALVTNPKVRKIIISQSGQ